MYIDIIHLQVRHYGLIRHIIHVPLLQYSVVTNRNNSLFALKKSNSSKHFLIKNFSSNM